MGRHSVLLGTLLVALCYSVPTPPTSTGPFIKEGPVTKAPLERLPVEIEAESEEEYFKRVGGENITGISYMLQLYKQLSNSSLQTPSNIIKSLKYEPCSGQNDSCNMFQFNMIGLDSHELFHQAKLRLFVERLVSRGTNYTAIIHVKNPQLRKQVPFVVQDIGSEEDGYIEFNVTTVFKHFIGKNNISVLTCQHDDEVLIVNNLLEEDKIPILTVHSYLKIEMKLGKTMELIRQQVEVLQKGPPTRYQRRKRHSTRGYACTVFDFVIPTRYIPSAAFSDYINFRPVFPVSYNSGICGGQCLLTAPHASSTPYSILLHGLIRQQIFSDYDYIFAQSCVPIKFNPIHILGVATGTVAVVSIDDMVIKTCGCADFAI